MAPIGLYARLCHAFLVVYISACGHPPQMKIYPSVCHLYPHQSTNFGSLISVFVKTATIFVTVLLNFKS